jgi:lactaldehyde dehydrogenase/glycolaldehyde dehydrogenase
MVTGTGLEVGAPLVESPIVRLITLTGSIRAGQAIAAASARNITALSLELGGKAPFIVLKDADIDEAVESAAVARFANCGQVCICNETVLVEEPIADEFTDKLLKRVAEIRPGDPMKNEGMGPVTTPDALARIDKLVQDSIAQGAELAMGGKRPEGAKFNKGIVGYIQGYHNGHKLSGLGGEDGIYGIEGYLQKRTVYMKY